MSSSKQSITSKITSSKIFEVFSLNQYSKNEKHLNSFFNHPILKKYICAVSKKNKSTFLTFFETKDKIILILRVKIPKDPISTPPKVYLDGVSALHPWLDENMRVAFFDPITSSESWQKSNLRLGDAIYQIVQHFQQIPPVVKYGHCSIERRRL